MGNCKYCGKEIENKGGLSTHERWCNPIKDDWHKEQKNLKSKIMKKIEHSGQYKKGDTPWISGKNHSKTSKERMSEKKKGKTTHMKGKHHTQEAIEKMRPSFFKKGHPTWIKGKTHKEYPQIPHRDSHHAWKGGKQIHSRGYIFTLKPDHPFCNSQGYIAEHRLIMESFLKEYLEPKNVVHHADGNVQNNRLANLVLFKSQSEHAKYHGFGGING